MQKLQDSVFSIVKTTNLSPAVFSYLQPSEDFTGKTPLGGILSDTKHGWLALGPKFCVVDLRTGLKVAARTFGAALSNFRTTVTSVVELPTSLTDNSLQLIISLECEDIAGMICVFHVNGSQILRCIQTEVVVTKLAVCDGLPDGPFTCFNGVVMAGTKSGDIFVFDLNRASLIQALKDIAQGYEHMLRSEENAASITFLPLNALEQIETQRDLALENDDHIAVMLNENSLVDGQYIFRNPDGTVRMKAKRDHIRVTVIQYMPQLGSLIVGFNFGAFQIWNLMTLDLEFTSQVNVECLPVTHFGFQEPCDDPRAFCYLWVVFSVLDRFEEEEFPLAVMYSLTYQGKRMLSDTKCLYQEFLTAAVRFQVELSTTEEDAELVGGRCVSCHSYSVNSMLGGEGEESMLNICQLVWECWGENANSSAQYGMLLFDLDQWYKDQMPATYLLQSNAFMSAMCCTELARGDCVTLDVRLSPASVSVYCAATRLEEHFYPNSLHYNCICLNTSETCVLSTIGIQRQIINSMDEIGPTALLNPTRLYNACASAGLVPLYVDTSRDVSQEEQRRYLLSVALEARLSRFLKRCAHDWATGSHSGAGCTLTFLVDWCWKRALELKENARELISPLFTSSALPDRNVVRCLDHSVQQLTQLTGLLDAVLTKCCNLVVPDALSEMEEKYKGIGTVSLYFQVVQWFLRCGLLPERTDSCTSLPYPGEQLASTYNKRRLKLHRLQDHSITEDNTKSCPLLYIDQLIEHEFGGDRIRQMWMRGGSEYGLYPPPSLYSLLRLYLLPDIAEEHKHSLVLYLLVDYSMVYDEVRYEAVIRRLMQFPTMFGLSNTAIKATQAFWHLDHRDFDFALDQLQCLTGNTLSEWQHNVVLSSLLAQKKTQAALQYLHVRKPAPIQNAKEDGPNKVNDHDKLDDWQSCCNLYLARGLVFEALDVIRMCVQNAGSLEDKAQVLNFFYKGCRNTGQLSKILQVTLLPFEEEVFIRYLENCNEPQTSDILIMYYLQQARYLEAEQYNNKLKLSRPRSKDMSTSIESLVDVLDREGARDTLVEVLCSSLPSIANTVAHVALERDVGSHVIVPKPMSVYVQAKSPKNTFTYKSSFIQDTIENASETWMNKPKMRKGIKRALNIEETPFICTPKLGRTRSVFGIDSFSESTPSKRARLDLTGTPKTPLQGTFKSSVVLSQQMAALLDMPEGRSSDIRPPDRSGADTPHSILKIRSGEALRDAVSPVDSRYLGDSDEEMLETASNHTHYSDSTNKHLRFTIPTASESGSTPSPPSVALAHSRIDPTIEIEQSASAQREKEMNDSIDSFVTTTTETHAMNEPHPLESPPKKQATEDNIQVKKSYKDSVRARRSLSISANSSLSDDPNTSIESIADIPITLINPRYTGERRRSYTELPEYPTVTKDTDTEKEEKIQKEILMEVPKTPKGRRGIRAVSGESTPLINRSRSVTPERQDSPITPLRPLRMTRSRSRTPELSPRSSPLESIPEQPKQEVESEPHPVKTTLSVPRQRRSRSRTPERIEKVLESPRLEAITESPTKLSDSPPSSPVRRSLRSRSRTPEVEVPVERPASPRSLRSRSKTPEKLMSPKKDVPKSAKKSLSRLVLEANAAKSVKNLDKMETETEAVDKTESIIECTPMKALKQVSNLMDVTFSPIVSKSILQSSNDSVLTENIDKEIKNTDESDIALQSIPAFTMNETHFGKSVLNSFDSTIAESSETSNVPEDKETKADENTSKVVKSLPVFTLSESYLGNSVLHSYETTVETSGKQDTAEISSKRETAESPSKQEAAGSSNEQKTAEMFSKQETAETCSKQETAETCSKQDTDESEKNKKKIIQTSISFNYSDINRSVLGQYEDSTIETSKEDMSPKKVINKYVEEASGSKSVFKNVSTLISQTTAAIIQREKEKIVEIEREIHEIEGEMSDEDDEDEGSDDVETGTDSDDDEVEDEESEVTAESSEDANASEEDEVISIDDSDSTTSSSNQIQVEEPRINVEIQTMPTSKENKGTEATIEVVIEATDKENEGTGIYEEIVESADPLNQAQLSLMTDDNSVRESDQSDVNLNYSQEKMETEMVIDVVKISTNDEVPLETDQQPVESVDQKQVTDVTTVIDKDKNIENEASKKNVPEESELKDSTNKPEEIDTTHSSTPTESEIKKIAEENIASISNVEQKAQPLETAKEESNEKDVPKEENKPVRRKRGKSTSSNKSTKEAELEIEKTEIERANTPMTRKRSQSIASNKSTSEPDQKTPEDDKNVESRRRAKTPTSIEGRKILTRRASKELTEKVNETDASMNESMSTPKRRSTRSRSKNVEDNMSIASGSSVRSTRSKASEDAGDLKQSQVRKGRKSILTTKPDLSVIPEVLTEESSKVEGGDDIMKEYSNSRRLTRHQKAVLESWLEPKPSPRRRISTASRTSTMSEHSHDDDVSSTHSAAFDVQPIDRISLLNKEEFQGSPDTSEAQTESPESIASDASKQRQLRATRAASESKPTPKAARISRRISVDIVGTPPGSPAAVGSPARGRRASFNRACEALHTPKGRRTSTDVKKGEMESQGGSPVASESEMPVTPARRGRRVSTSSNSSQIKADTSKRSKKTSAIDESKDTKKK